MRTIRLFGLLTMVVGLLGLSSCGKDYDGDISDLNDKYKGLNQRVAELQNDVTKINTEMTTLSKLAKAVESGFYVTEVKTTAAGYELMLSNGSVIDLQNGPSNTLSAAPYISMTVINNVHYWTVNGMLITDKDGKPIPATGQTPVVQYNTTTNQWVISVDGGMNFQNLNVYASIVINDQVLLQVINNYISQHNTTIFSEQMLYQIITTYIQENYSKIFNMTILNKVIVNYLNQHYTTVFNYELLVKLFDQYNFEYTAKNIDVDIVTKIIIDFIQNNSEIFVNNEVLFEIIRNYIELNQSNIFDIDIIAQVINNFIEKNTNFIDINVLTRIINNYIDQHQDIIFNNETFITIIQEYVQENYMLIFNENILLEYFKIYITENQTNIFNKELVLKIVNEYVKNNYTTIIDKTVIQNIINNYITENKTTVISEDILVEIIDNYFKTYNITIDEAIVKNIINKYILELNITDIDISVVEYVVKQYISKNINVIFDIDILNQIIVEIVNNQTFIQNIVSEYKGIIENVVVDGDVCIVTLNNKQTIQLLVYDAYARVRDRVQSIVVVPNSNGHVTGDSYGNGRINLTYLVTPASMANVIANEYKKDNMVVELLLLNEQGNYTAQNVSDKFSGYEGKLTEYTFIPLSTKAIALRVKDKKSGGTDYTTTFTPIDWKSN